MSPQTFTDTDFDLSLEPEVLTERTPTKTIPCRKCHRPCVVTMFATPAKTECLTCRGVTEEGKRLQLEERERKAAERKVAREERETERKQGIQIKQAHTVDPATVDDLRDALINPAFRQSPCCPFDGEHEMTLISIAHSPNYGPRKLEGHDRKTGQPMYKQECGESVVYQCQECRATVSYSTMHPSKMLPQNHARLVPKDGPGILEQQLGTEPEPESMLVDNTSDEEE